MSEPALPLDQVQRWLQAVITHPRGVARGLASDEARGHLDVPPDDVEQVISRSQAQTSIERLAIYSNAYYARLKECLQQEYPTFFYSTGEELFDLFAADYLRRYPSRSYTLGQLGAAFPKFLIETRGEVSDEQAAKGIWQDFLIELATFDRAISEVFDGPGVEGQPLLQAEQLAAVPAGGVAHVRLLPVPCLRLFRFRFRVNAYFTAIRRQEQPSFSEPEETFLAITRRDYIVRRYELDRPQYILLQGLMQGLTLGAAIENALESEGGSTEAWIANLRRWFQHWTTAGFFQGMTLLDPAASIETPLQAD